MPPGRAAGERRAERVDLEELAVQAPRGQEPLEDVAEADEEARADHADDLALPVLVPAALEERALEQPGEADVVGQVLDLRRLALALRGVLGEVVEVRGRGVVATGRARAAARGGRPGRGSGGSAR